MSVADIIVLLVLAVVLFFAIRAVIKKKGGCSCGCGGSCSCGCGGKKQESSDSKN